MTLNEHKKHVDIQKPEGGNIHRNEFGFIGAPCDVIQNLCGLLAKEIPDYKLGYVDADHGESAERDAFYSKYTDKITHHNLSLNSQYIDYEFRNHFLSADAVLINANHFKADKQIVIINEKKKESLSKKLDKLNNVLCFVLDNDQNELHDYLKTRFKDFETIPVFKINEVTKLSELIVREIEANIPKIKGLLLAGGKSQRMGYDKTLINYHGVSQKEFMMDLLGRHCDSSYISIAQEEDDKYPKIEDTFKSLGPFGGILSAFRFDPNAAWLTVAVDIPLLNDETIEKLIKERNSNVCATCFHNPQTNFPEPMITIWEPRIYPRLLNFLSKGYSCPRKALINSEIEELEIENADILFNANTPEEVDAIKSKIN